MHELSIRLTLICHFVQIKHVYIQKGCKEYIPYVSEYVYGLAKIHIVLKCFF